MSKFLRQSLMIFIIKGLWTIVIIFIVISTTFRPICPPAFFRCLSISGTYKFDKHPKKAGWHIGRNVVEITIIIKMKPIVWKLLTIKKRIKPRKKFILPHACEPSIYARVEGSRNLHTWLDSRRYDTRFHINSCLLDICRQDKYGIA